jgi:hypothetical protein
MPIFNWLLMVLVLWGPVVCLLVLPEAARVRGLIFLGAFVVAALTTPLLHARLESFLRRSGRC